MVRSSVRDVRVYVCIGICACVCRNFILLNSLETWAKFSLKLIFNRSVMAPVAGVTNFPRRVAEGCRAGGGRVNSAPLKAFKPSSPVYLIRVYNALSSLHPHTTTTRNQRYTLTSPFS